MAVGSGYRAINFLKLWTLVAPEHVHKHFCMVFANIMEIFMARAFQSLPPGVLEQYFGCDNYSGTGLNAVPRLLQSISLNPSLRYHYSLQLEKSPDPEIRAWPKYRQEQKAQEPICLYYGPRLTRQQYLDVLTLAARTRLGIPELKPIDTHSTLPRTPINIKTRLDDCAQQIKTCVDTTRTLILPRGALETQIGIILDQSSYIHNVQDISHGIFSVLYHGVWRKAGLPERILLYDPLH
ncbi:hypothetical protein BJX63DRAFT_374686 [Aspergillus granulosus]|uniref:Uncharacterized protein n=1 Tax=Aspergillus granulosus TaxID=176169 RepID=A0ABR4H0J5_9EURO